MNKRSQKTPVEKVQTVINAWLVFVAIVILIAAITPGCSSSRYIKEGPAGSCGVWYPKKCKIGTKNW